MDSFFSVERMLESFPLILSRLPVTLSIVVIATGLGLILGTVAAVIRINKIPVLNRIVLAGISFLRGTPIIVQLFVVYFGLPVLLKLAGINAARWSKLIFVNITYSLNISAFLSEIIRGALNGVDPGQREAALSVGLTGWQTFRRIIAPQSLLIALPSFSVSILNLLQNTSLGFTIGIVDMVGQVRAIGTRTYHVIEAYVDAAIIFVVLSFILNYLFSLVEKRLRAKIMKTGD
ncbi:MAG: amino acid ABC transporter permease [Treponema sp.]|nr:amino acid ABC transporter permease [Treponema sp.]